MMKVVLIACLVACAFSSPAWEQFKADYSKVYESAEEESSRQAIFNENVARINADNADGVHGISKFMDMTPNEFQDTMLRCHTNGINKPYISEQRKLWGSDDSSPSDDYPSDDYPSDDYPSDDYPSDDYPSDDYPSDDYPSDDYPSDDSPSDDYPSDDSPSDDYPSDDSPSDDSPSDDSGSDDGQNYCQAAMEGHVYGDLPDTWDWRDKKAVTPVKDQQQCGSCWAFSTVETIESGVFLNGGELLDLSPQQVVSCDHTDLGCNGGDPPTAYRYVVQAGGIELNKDYPYTSGGGDTGKCKADSSEWATNISGCAFAVTPCESGSCKSQNETGLQWQLVNNGPLSICVNAQPWQTYSHGIMTGHQCKGAAADLDHCVQLVGYDTTGSQHYWIVRNSWNTGWGIDGYIHLSMGENTCGVADEVTYIIK